MEESILSLRRISILVTMAVASALVGCAGLPTATEPSAPSGVPPVEASASSLPEPMPSNPQEPSRSAAAPQSGPGTHKPEVNAARAGLDSLNPDGLIDFSQPDARRDLWQRIRHGFVMPDLRNQDLVRQSEQWYAARPDYVQRMTSRGARYLFHIVEEVQRRGMPTELALLPFIESAFNPQALSSAKASGMWQFMPATGRDFSLRQNVFRDDRRDVLASTRAALDYLTRLHAQFGHWHLALAAYNWGEGNLQRAIARNQKAGLPTDYENLRMPDETRRYVPKLLAVKNIVLQPQDHGLTLPPLENHPYFLTVAIERDIDVSLAARLAGLPIEEFNALNPQHNKPVILAAGSPRILLPYDNAERFLVELGRHAGLMATWTAWVAPKTLRAAEAARLTGMPETELREVNRIPRGMMIRSGSTLLVPRSARNSSDVSEQVAQTALMNLQREPVAKKSTRKPTGPTVAKSTARPTTRTASTGQANAQGKAPHQKSEKGAKTAAAPSPTVVAGGGRPATAR